VAGPARAARRGPARQGLRPRRRDPRPIKAAGIEIEDTPTAEVDLPGVTWQATPAQGLDPQDRQEADRRLRRPRQARPRGQGPDAQGQGPPEPQGLQAAPRRSARPRPARSAHHGATPSGSPGATRRRGAARRRPGQRRVRRRGRRARRPAARGLPLAAERGISLLEVTKSELDRMTAGAVHQGWPRGSRRTSTPPRRPARPGRRARRAAADRRPRLGHRPAQPRRRGAQRGRLRRARRADPGAPRGRHDGRGWKTSAGAAARIPVAQTVNLVRQLKAYQDAGCMVVGLAADGDVSLPDLDLGDGPLVSSSARRARACPAWSPRPATSWCRSRWPTSSSPSTPASPPASPCTPWRGPAPEPSRLRKAR
jgi:23S rRNA (guanosine2251-2'-O)-methyltransferase